METIKNYLDNMFASLPKTSRVLDLKSNLLNNMEEKYNELKRQGKSENEAIGIVISEFGNIDELANELGIRPEEADTTPLITKEEVEGYLNVKSITGRLIGIGVMLCILGAVCLIILTTIFENQIIPNDFATDASSIIGVIVLLLFVAIAVGLFIYSGWLMEKYQYMEKGVQLPIGLEAELKQASEKYQPTFYLQLIIGVCLLVISPITVIATSLMADTYQVYGVATLLVIVSISVYLFISSGTKKESYDRLLKTGDYAVKQNKKEDKVIGAVASIVWPLATVIFLFTGFVYDLWSKSWIIFPITGVLFGMFCAAYSIITQKEE